MLCSFQDMIENVLEIKDTHVREVMTPLIDVVAIDASASLIDFHNLWVKHQYSRYVTLVVRTCANSWSQDDILCSWPHLKGACIRAAC